MFGKALTLRPKALLLFQVLELSSVLGLTEFSYSACTECSAELASLFLAQNQTCCTVVQNTAEFIDYFSFTC